jgi:tetratricopeptide (TPR) repeat protein
VTTPITAQDGAAKMDAALMQWDKNISAVEDRVKTTRNIPDLRAAQMHVELGVAYQLRGRLTDAVREFDVSLRLRPSGSDVRVLRALALEALGRPAEAAQSFQDAWILDPVSGAKAYYVASRPGIDKDAREKARAFLTSKVVSGFSRTIDAQFAVVEAIPDSFGRSPIVGDGMTGEAFALLAAGRFKEAIAALARAGHDPAVARRDSPRLHLARGQAAESLNRVPDARREYEASLAGALAGRSMILIAIARLAQVDGDLPGAIDALTRATRLNPNDAFIRYELSAALAADGRTDDAIVELAAAIVINSRDAQAYAALGQLHLDAARYPDAISAFTRALELAPDRYELRYSLATVYTRLGDTARAAQELETYDAARRNALDARRKSLASADER